MSNEAVSYYTYNQAKTCGLPTEAVRIAKEYGAVSVVTNMDTYEDRFHRVMVDGKPHVGRVTIRGAVVDLV